MKIAILTSGGDAPGMNAAIESIVRKGAQENFEIYGAISGIKGIYENNFMRLTLNSVKNIYNLAGSIIKSSRFISFRENEVQKICIDNLIANKFDYVIIIGGNGSLKAASIFQPYVKSLFIPATIDNDVPELESIGFDTALNSAMEAIDKIKSSAETHDRNFIIEVMGNKSGKLAHQIYLSSAGNICITKEYPAKEDLSNKLKQNPYNIVIFSENVGNISEYIKDLENVTQISLKHIQRGGSPTAKDRILAKIYGIEAINKIKNSESGIVYIDKLEKYLEDEIYNG